MLGLGHGSIPERTVARPGLEPATAPSVDNIHVQPLPNLRAAADNIHVHRSNLFPRLVLQRRVDIR